MLARCNLITGFLGVGKTTLIRHLLAHRPPDERWAVIVNDFGVVGIDGTTLAAASAGQPAVAIREVAGGCICCAANVPLRVAITEVLRRIRPDRLLIEPSGLGHPAAILATLAAPGLAGAIEVGAVICVADPRLIPPGEPHTADQPGHRPSNGPRPGQAGGPHAAAAQTGEPGAAGAAGEPSGRDGTPLSPGMADTWRDQLAVADVVVVNKCDLAADAQRERFLAFVHGLYPPKQAILFTTHGELGPRWLDTPRARWRPVLLGGHPAAPAWPAPPSDAMRATDMAEVADAAGAVPPGIPVPGLGNRYSAASLHVRSLGWLFDDPACATAAFDSDRLDRLLIRLPALLAGAGARLLRAKGALRTSAGAQLIEWSAGRLGSEPLAFVGPGRLELLFEPASAADPAAPQATDDTGIATAIETALEAALAAASGRH